jgi:DNA-directed RNA polymerase subunit RPC12/RpoP
MTEKCAECGRDLPVNSESIYCSKCDALLDKKFDLIEMNLIVYKELSDAEIETLNKFDKEDIINLYLKLFDSYREDGDFDKYEAAILNKIQNVFNLTEKEIGGDKVVKFDETKIVKKHKPLVCIKCNKPILKDDFVFCPYCGFKLD